MEKNQHNSTAETTQQQNNSGFAGSQPGQQPAANNNDLPESRPADSGKKEQHSESSFPQQEGETLGTP